MRIERIKACLNGQRRRAEHHAVPMTPAELAVAAADAVAAGAEAVHLHARGADGAESVLAADIGAASGAVRRACPGVTVGVSTGLWITAGDVDRRQAAVAAWAGLPAGERPDFASVNLAEPGLDGLLAALRSAGVGVEAGLWSPADAHTFSSLGPAGGWLRILVEIVEGPAEAAAAAADAIIRRLDDSGITAPVVVHGQDETCWPLVAYAGRRGLATRIGLEDTVLLPDGSPAGDNAELVRLALRIWTDGKIAR